MKFFPNNIAALQLGNITVSAKLEAPLTAGQTYWLEVVRAGGVPQLKILDHNAVRRDGQQTQAQVLQQLGISWNKVNEVLIRHLATEQIPFTKDVFEKAAHLLQQSGLINKEGLQILTILFQKNFPMTLESFYAIRAMNYSQTPLLSQIVELHSSLQHLEKENSDLRPYLNGLQMVMKEMQIPEGKHPFIQLLYSASSGGTSGVDREGAIQLLHRTGIMATNITVDQLFEQFKAQLIDPVNQQKVAKLWPTLLQNEAGPTSLHSLDGKTLFQVLLPRLEQPVAKVDQQQQLQLLLQLFQSKVNATQITEQLLRIQRTLPELSTKESDALTFMLNQSVHNEHKGERSTIASQLLRMIASVGYLHERELAQFFQAQTTASNNNYGEQLKSLLLQLNQLHLSTAMKDKVDLMIQRITGQQMLAQEMQGPILHTFLQIPVQLGEWQTELTVQWEGKRTPEGKVNPNHCRILFYLNLAHLKETIVDVQIQQKIITLQVFNENERPDILINTLQPLLKKQLAELGYTLSNVKWIHYKKQQLMNGPAQKAYTQRYEYEGVDVRI